jgi:hypothetical protein
MQYFKREKPGGQWEEITGIEMMNVINAHFDIQPRRSWDGSEKPSRQQVADYIHNGDILNLYSADYKAQPPAYPMVEGEGAAQYSFDVPENTQLALF